jgi:hypothetical protein
VHRKPGVHSARAKRILALLIHLLEISMKFIQLPTLAIASTLCAFAHAYPTAILGDAVPDSPAARNVTLTPDTRSVDVRFGETVVFNANGTRFAWQFYTPARSFDLNQIAPAASLAKRVRVYVGPDLNNNE